MVDFKVDTKRAYRGLYREDKREYEPGRENTTQKVKTQKSLQVI